MKTLKLLIILSIFLTLDCYAQDSDSIIYWNSNIKLCWKDFKGPVPDTTEYDVATSYIEIFTKGERSLGLPNYRIYPTFNRYKSWSKDTTNYVLNHEQGHFDIGELYARKMRSSILRLREKGVESIDDYLKMLYFYNDECVKFNVQYDSETAHGVYKSKQIEWSKKIAKELFELKKYEVN